MTPPNIEGSRERLRIDVHVEPGQAKRALADDVRRGLSATPKQLLPKYFYDDAGSELFERITKLPEYYPTRAERGLLEAISPALMARLRPAEMVELGSGSSAKTHILLGAESTASHLRRYFPFDVSEGIVRQSAMRLVETYPYLFVHGVIGDFETDLPKIPGPEGARLVLFLGSTIGNLHPPERRLFLEALRTVMGPDGHALIGMDLAKDPAVIERAYDDAAGVTAAFNRNVLHVINRELGADFAPDAYRHVAFFDARASRIEMHLEAEAAQRVHIAALDMDVRLAAGERIWTESSYKFTRASVEQDFAGAGLVLTDWFATDDPAELFALALAAPA